MDTENETDLYKALAAKHGWPDSKYLPMIFKRVVNPTEAKILLSFPATTEQIVEKLQIAPKKLEDLLQVLYEKGLAFPTRKGWRIGRITDALHDLTLSNTKYWESYGGEEFGDLWRAFERLEWWPPFIDHMRQQATERPVMRVVPNWKAVKDFPELIPEEDLREIYKRVGSIVLIPCPCRREMYDRKCGTPDEMCISLGRSAEYNLKRGVGRKLTVEEALEFEESCAKNNSFTIVPNSPKTDMVICHCHACCCVTVLAFNSVGAPLVDFCAKSRFEAEVNAPKCIACQKCMAACQFEAIEMKKHPDMTQWKAHIISEKCMGCGVCVANCPTEGAVALKVVRPPEHIPQEELDVYAYGDVKK